MAVTARRSIECLLATVPVEEPIRAGARPTAPLGRVEPPPGLLVTELLPAGYRPGSALPWPRHHAASVATATAPLPPAVSAPAVFTRPVAIEVPCPPIRRTPRSSAAEARSPAAQGVVPGPRDRAVSWLLVASTAAFFGMVAALLTRWWMG
jgi:hypothetical protein